MYQPVVSAFVTETLTEGWLLVKSKALVKEAWAFLSCSATQPVKPLLNEPLLSRLVPTGSLMTFQTQIRLVSKQSRTLSENRIPRSGTGGESLLRSTNSGGWARGSNSNREWSSIWTSLSPRASDRRRYPSAARFPSIFHNL